MSTLSTQFQQIEPCDGRDLIQALTAQVITRITELRSKLCEQVSNSLAEFGFEDIDICKDLDEKFFTELQEKDATVAVSYILSKKGFPPYMLKILKDGVEGLEDKELQDVLYWVSPVVGVNFPNNTASYIRDKRVTRKPVLTPSQQEEVYQALVAQNVIDIQTVIREAIQTYIFDRIKCPKEEVLQKLIKVTQNLVVYLNNYLRAFENFKIAINTASALVSAINVSITGLKAVITANDLSLPATAATPTGAAGLVANISRILSIFVLKNEDRVRELDERLCAAASAVTYVNASLNVAYGLVTAVESILLSCLNTEGDLGISSRLTPRSFSPGQGTTYRGYVLEVRTVVGDSALTPRRYAVALNSQGIVILEGTPSFSSDTQVLLDEIKFRIDNHLG